MIFCKRCGTYSAKGVLVCPRCQADLAAFGHESMSGAPPSVPVTSLTPAGSGIPTGAPAVSASSSEYGGFWNRLLAIIIDGLLMMVVTMIPMFVIMFALVGTNPSLQSLARLGSMLVVLALGYAALMVVPIVYEVVMIAKKGATYGKSFRKLVVVRTNGQPVSMGYSILRVLGKLLSGILFIGYLMALFTAKKQTLHDLIADTVVVRSGS